MPDQTSSNMFCRHPNHTRGWPGLKEMPPPEDRLSLQRLPASKSDGGSEGSAKTLSAKAPKFLNNCSNQKSAQSTASQLDAVILENSGEAQVVVDPPSIEMNPLTGGVRSQRPFKSIFDNPSCKYLKPRKYKGFAELPEQPESSQARARCYQLLVENFMGGPSQAGGDIIVQHVPSFEFNLETSEAGGIISKFDERYIS